MLNKTIACFTAALMTLSVFTATVSTMNYAADSYGTQQNVA